MGSIFIGSFFSLGVALPLFFEDTRGSTLKSWIGTSFLGDARSALAGDKGLTGVTEPLDSF